MALNVGGENCVADIYLAPPPTVPRLGKGTGFLFPLTSSSRTMLRYVPKAALPLTQLPESTILTYLAEPGQYPKQSVAR